jgi:hypothetical protein
MDAISPLLASLPAADFVVFEGVVLKTEYLRVPDDGERLVADDVVLEARLGDDELSLTFGDVDGAKALGEGVFRLASGATLRLVTQVTVH